MNKNIWDILNPCNNDNLSSMNKKELEELKVIIKNYLLELREELNFSKKNTFGIEIEVENVRENFYNLENDKTYENWLFSNDDTLIHGREVISPILKDDNQTWNTINNFINKLGNCSEILSTCGAHIHIGTQIFKNNNLYYERLYKLWCAYENIIFRFGYGEYLTERCNIKYAYPLLERTIKFDPIYLKTNMCSPLNYANVKEMFDYQDYIKGNTIEVRCPNGTLNPIIWQNNINFFIKLFEYVKSDNFDETGILKRIFKLKEKKYTDILELYRLIDMEGALELADLIFDTNLDKVYFLRQYIKDDKIGTKKLEKGEKFTKCLKY